jgi:hypothetical protein
MFEKRVLIRIFGRKRDEVTGGWRKLQNGGSSIISTLPKILKRSNRFLVKNVKERDHSKDPTQMGE